MPDGNGSNPSKNIPITERVRLQFRAESFNVFNHPEYGPHQANISSTSSFGQILSTVNTGPIGTGTPREIQFMLRLAF